MAFFVYILRCADGSYYTGHSDDLEKRTAEHESGAISGYTSRRLPVTVVFVEEFPTRLEALEREMQVKSWSRAKKKALTAGDWNALSKHARGH